MAESEVWRKRVVEALERGCGRYDAALHRLPDAVQARMPYCPLAKASYALDVRWRTGWWHEPGAGGA